MSSNGNGNGKGKAKAKEPKPVKVNIAAHLQIMEIYNELEKAKARLNLALSILQKQLGLDESWNYQTDQRAFLPPTQAPTKGPLALPDRTLGDK